MQTAFERIIATLPHDLSVMDVGYGGLDGENTTNYLRAYFDKVNGLCKDVEGVARYKALHIAEPNDSVTLGTYPQDFPPYKFDLLVLDPRIEDNLTFWSHEGMAQAWEFVNDGGYIITYIMGTDDYGDDASKARLKQHRQDWWGTYKLEPVMEEQEERRPEITWVLLKKP